MTYTESLLKQIKEMGDTQRLMHFDHMRELESYQDENNSLLTESVYLNEEYEKLQDKLEDSQEEAIDALKDLDAAVDELSGYKIIEKELEIAEEIILNEGHNLWSHYNEQKQERVA